MKESIKGIVVCVEYDDLLKLTLPQNIKHLEEVLVVTAPRDQRTQEFVATIPNARCFVTDAFYRNGAKFNKGLALEEGFDALGRNGWILIHDADTMLPAKLELDDVQLGNLYCAPRRMLVDPKRYHSDLNWKSLPLKQDPNEFPGYFQLFHAHDPVIKNKPWYGINWTHAGGCDSVFQARWPRKLKRLLPFEVLHLGPDGQNWYGRVSARRDGLAIPEAQQRAADLEKMRRNRAKNTYRGGGTKDERLG